MGTPKNKIQRHGERVLNVPQETVTGVSTPEGNYISEVDAKHRKAFGQFFTPSEIAQSMACWINGCNPKKVLDPAVGPGILLEQFSKLNQTATIRGVDLDPSPLRYAIDRLPKKKNVHLESADFLLLNEPRSVDAITCNPPYVRHHLLNYDREVYSRFHQTIPGLMQTSNLYVLFVAAIWETLKDGGRASILLPADWMNSNFGVPFKRFLQTCGGVRRIAFFTNEVEVFSDALTTAVVLFLEKKAVVAQTDLFVIDQNKNVDFCSLGNEDPQTVKAPNRISIDLATLDPLEKWDQLLQGKISDIPENWEMLGKFSSTRRGIATGANKFFHLSAAEVKLNDLDIARARECIGRAQDAPGLIYGASDRLHSLKSSRIFLMDLNPDFDKDALYLKQGEALDLPSRFLLASRKSWWQQEVRPASPIWVGVFGRDGIRFIRNSTQVVNLTTFHCLYPENLNSIEMDSLTAILNSSLLQEINLGSQRAYGGGLQKVEPKDILTMYVPTIRDLTLIEHQSSKDALKLSDKLLRARSKNWREPLDVLVEQLFL
jgi:adenine-specific DNA-methyltransferase